MFATAYTYLLVMGIRRETALGPLFYLPQAGSKERGGRRIFQATSETCVGAAWRPSERVQVAGVKWAREVSGGQTRGGGLVSHRKNSGLYLKGTKKPFKYFSQGIRYSV